jgi:hypothetical protein
MINYIKSLFSSKKKSQSKTDESIIDVIISLNKNAGIDVSIFIDDTNKDIDRDIIEYSEKCAEFFHIINSGKLKKQILDILINQIKKEDNNLLIDNIVTFWSIIEKQKRKPKFEKAFICPTEVFTKHISK